MKYKPNTPATLLATSIQLALLGYSGLSHAADVVLPAVEVKAEIQAETSTGPIKGYAAKRSSTGNKTDTAIIETPQSISVVGAEQIKNQGAQSLGQALAYTAGVLAEGSPDNLTDDLVLRGFNSMANGQRWRDGLLLTANRYDGQQEGYGLERIEFLKGAASLLFGTAAPGGVINTVSKRPSKELVQELGVSFGSLNSKQINADLGGALDEEGIWTWRLTGLMRKADSQTEHISDQRSYLAPALKWQANANTSLTLLANYQTDQSAYAWPLQLMGTIDSNPNGKLARNRFIGEPDFDHTDSKQYSLGYLFEHAFSPSLKLRHSARYSSYRSDWGISTDFGLSEEDFRTLARGFQDRYDDSTVLSSDTSLEYRLSHGKVEHTLLLGLDLSKATHGTERYDRTLGSLDIFNPVYGQVPSAERKLSPYSSNSENKSAGLYLQDQIKIDNHWVASLGGRYDHSTASDDPLLVGAYENIDEQSSAFSGRAGLIYLADNGLAPFFSWSQSFEPASGKDKEGKRFKPTQGEQYELGLRYQPSGRTLQLNATAFQITQSNVVTANSAAPDDLKQVGEVRSRGIELEAQGEVARGLNVLAAYSYTDARTTQSKEASEIGSRNKNVPYHMLSIWSDYAPQLIPGLKLGAGVRYIGDAPSGIYTLPSYALLDAMITYDTGKWQIALNGRNLTDKEYFTECSWSCFYGKSRQVNVSANYRW